MAKNQAHLNIPDFQRTLPVALDQNNKPVTLQQIIDKDPNVVVRPPDTLSADDWLRLAIERIKAQPKYEIGMIGAGIIDQARAIDEMKKRTDLGMQLASIQQGVNTRLFNQFMTE